MVIISGRETSIGDFVFYVKYFQNIKNIAISKQLI